MRIFIEQIGGKQIMSDQWQNLDGVRNNFYVVEDGMSIKIFNKQWYTLDQVKKLCQCVKEMREKDEN